MKNESRHKEPMVVEVRNGRRRLIPASVMERRHIRERLALRNAESNVLFKPPGPKKRPSFIEAEPLQPLD